MGAGQSAPRKDADAAAAAAVSKTCYYEVLKVDRQADDAEIRKAYKKKALELHPDRNYGDEQNATHRFAEVQTAYEILSDPQERAWYDSHRDAILGGHDPDDDYDFDADAPRPARAPDRYTDADAVFALMGRFDSTVPMTDSPAGFFGSLNAFFAQLADEEMAVSAGQGLAPDTYPPFGLAGDSHDAVARPFYAAWTAFATRKSFAWKDRYRVADAPDRGVRRVMERENRKLRSAGVREFNDAVRSLVAFVRRRDPRYVPNTQSEAERQRVLRDSAAAQAARSRAANRAKLDGYVVPDWVQARGGVHGDGDGGGGDNSEFSDSDEDASEVEEIECVVCNKSFRSEKQFEAHEKSRKHAKAVQRLQWEMRKENADLNLSSKDGTDAGGDADPGDGQDQEEEEAVEPESSRGKKKKKKKKKAKEQQQAREAKQSEGDGAGTVEGADGSGEDGSDGASAQGEDSTGHDHNTTKPGQDEGDDEAHEDDEDCAPRFTVEERLLPTQKAAKNHDASQAHQPEAAADEREATPSLQDLSLDDGISNSASASNAALSGGKKVGKARLKREKKAARQASTVPDPSSHTCAACNTPFPSRTKLFAHINKTKHAAPVVSGTVKKEK